MILNFIHKVVGLYVHIRYYAVPVELRPFYKDTIRCKMMQLKYLIKDFITKKPYKNLDFGGEFAPELQFVLPFAYWHYMNGTLESTSSAVFTKEIYFFSPDHTEKYATRSNEGNYNFEMPRILYSQDYSIDKWEQVPLKAHYQNDLYAYNLPLLIIANRYNSEWDEPPISFFSIELLDYLLPRLLNEYKVLYNRPQPQHISMDHSEVYDLEEYNWIKEKYPEVLMMKDLYVENKANANNFNHFQLLVYANAEKYLSIHGGTATLASYFGGTNIILSKKGPEHHFRCFEKLYPKLSGAEILHAHTEEDVKSLVQTHYLTKVTTAS